jgi:hypothetical protein
MKAFQKVALSAIALLAFGGAMAQQKESNLAPLSLVSKNAKEADSDLVIIAHRLKLPLSLTKNIAGEEVLIARPENGRPVEAGLCIVADAASYPDLSVEEVTDILSARIVPWLGKAVPLAKPRLRQADCLTEDNEFKDVTRDFPELIAIERRFLPALKEVMNYQVLQPVGVIGKDFVFETRKQLASEKRAVEDRRKSELDALADAAKASDTSKLGSLALGNPGEKIDLCFVGETGVNKPFYLGYSFNYMQYLSKEWLARAKEKNPQLKAESNKFYTKSFKTLDELYVQMGSGSSGCDVFVGTPAEIQMLRSAILRDTGKPNDMIGALVPKSELGEYWAKAVGYQSYAQHLLAEKIDAKPELVKQLAQFGIDSEAKFAEIKSQMQASRYADPGTAQDVLSFLRDKQSGDKEGKTAVMVRSERQKRERVDAEKREADQKRAQQEYAKKFPYTAVVSCSVGESSLVTLVACFTTKYTNTELELKNGDDYRMFTPRDLLSAGHITESGLEIPLRSSFSLKAQNAAENLLLTVKVIDNKTGQVAFKKSASQFGVVRITN